MYNGVKTARNGDTKYSIMITTDKKLEVEACWEEDVNYRRMWTEVRIKTNQCGREHPDKVNDEQNPIITILERDVFV